MGKGQNRFGTFSRFSTLFHNFSHFFPQDFLLKSSLFLREWKRIKRKRPNHFARELLHVCRRLLQSSFRYRLEGIIPVFFVATSGPYDFPGKHPKDKHCEAAGPLEAPKPRKNQSTIAAKIITKNLFTKIISRGNYFCSYYKNTLHSARKKLEKDHKAITNIIVSGNYFVIISARMVGEK